MTDTAVNTAMPDPFTSSLAGRRLGRYEVLARLASGGMAGVYVARAIGVAGFERLFAIKVLHPHLAHEEEFITMFLDEARLAARIRHPNVVPTIDISDTQDAGYFLVMDYIEGDHLGALLQKAFKLGSRLPAPIALRIIVDALDGLAAAHNLTDEHGNTINLVHRDISPHNIMVSTDGIARITDFGVAKAEVRLSTTREGQFKGKLAYMAPEHASNGDADQRSDLFSMGIILWESLTGRRLFRAENHAATLNKICLEPIPMPSEVDPGLAPFDHVLAKALAREPAERFQTAEEFADAIEQTADTLGGLANQRAVAKLVKEYAAEKLTRDESLIRNAISEIGVAVPSDASALMSTPAGAMPSRMPFAPPPIEAPSALEEAPVAKRRVPIVVLGALAALVAGLAVAALLMRDEEPDVTSEPLEPTPQEVAPAPPPSEPSIAAPAPSGEDTAAEAAPEPEQAPSTQSGQRAPVDRRARSPQRHPAEPRGTAERATVPAPEPEPERPTAEPSRRNKAKRPKSAPDKAADVTEDVLLNPYRQKK